ncbi:MAG: hypothetical protein LBL90_11175 [Prevotellaceae bacterium]|jgi:hypothetical protein|nr:hypothetical protein [Prevotellaceae bacterium]
MKSIKDFQKENVEQVPLNDILGGATDYVVTGDGTNFKDIWDTSTGYDDRDLYAPDC